MVGWMDEWMDGWMDGWIDRICIRWLNVKCKSTYLKLDYRVQSSNKPMTVTKT